MNVTGKMLLNSAETIIRSRQEAGRTGDALVLPPAATDSVSAQGSAMQSRMLELTGRLKQTQAEYSREQMRMSFLKSGKLDPDAVFDEQPLFPEKDASVPELQLKVEQNLEKLLHSLRSVQVEMENLYALNFPGLKAVDLTQARGDFRNFDPQRVAHLTR